MAQIRNPDGSVTYTDEATGASRTVLGGKIVSQNYADPLSQQSGIKIIESPSVTKAVQDFQKAIKQGPAAIEAFKPVAATTAKPKTTAPAPSPTPTTMLRPGSRGIQVTDLQRQLQTAGFDPGPIDGIFGPRTAAAVRAFQQSKGLTVDAIAGPQTYGALRENVGLPPTAATDLRTLPVGAPVGVGQPSPTPQVNPLAPAPSQLPPTTPAPTDQYGQQTTDLLAQLRQRFEQPAQYDPAADPAYRAMSKQVARNVMEVMNQRGILNSSITEDDMAQAMADIIPQLQQQFYGRQQEQFGNLRDLFTAYSGLEKQGYEREQEAARLEREAKQQQLKDAWSRTQDLGYVDNQASVALGIPVGTPTHEAKKAYEDQKIRRAQEARLSAAPRLSPKDQAVNAAWQRITSGQATDMDYAIADVKTSVQGGVDTTALMKQYRDLVNMINDPAKPVPPAQRKFIEDQIAAIEQQLMGGAGPGGTAADLSPEEIRSMIDTARASGDSDEEIAQSLKNQGIDPSLYGLSPKRVPISAKPIEASRTMEGFFSPIGGR